ncbi:uncharacterized [Tachysurus ichikawai]
MEEKQWRSGAHTSSLEKCHFKRDKSFRAPSIKHDVRVGPTPMLVRMRNASLAREGIKLPVVCHGGAVEYT